MQHAQLRAFHAVAIDGSFTRAAARLRVTQPAVTMHVRALEAAYGVELFHRRGRRVEPSELGRALVEVTRRLFVVEAEAEELLVGARKLLRGELRVGADGPYHVLSLLSAFRKRHSKVAIKLSMGNAANVLSRLLAGETDVAIVAEVDPDPRLFAVPCARHRLVAFVARTHAWAKKKKPKVHLADFDGEPMILREKGSITRRTFERAIVAARVRPKVVMEIDSREAVREAVAEGLGVGVVMSAEFVRDARLIALPIADAVLENTEYAVCLDDHRKLRVVRAFFDVVPALTR